MQRPKRERSVGQKLRSKKGGGQRVLDRPGRREAAGGPGNRLPRDRQMGPALAKQCQRAHDRRAEKQICGASSRLVDHA